MRTTLKRHEGFSFVAFIGILLIAAFLRLSNLAWDANTHLHPDERFLTSVVTDINWPASWKEFFDTANSPLNPHNRSHTFYVYGTFPLFLVKSVAEVIKKTDFDALTLTGRLVSALLEIGTVALVFAIARRVTKNTGIALLSMLLYGLMVTPIQTAHYFTVDSYLSFFVTCCLYFLTRPSTPLSGIGLGISFGLLLASKISGIYLLPTIGAAFLTYFFVTKKYLSVIASAAIFGIVAGVTLRVAQPYLFVGPNPWNISLNPKILANWKELENANTLDTHFPPALQWIPTKPYTYPFIHQTVWAIGLPIMVTSIIAGLYLALTYGKHLKISRLKKIPYPLSFFVIWTLTLWMYQGGQVAKPLRYIYPVHSAMSILFAYVLYNAIIAMKLSNRTRWFAIAIFSIVSIWWSVGVTSFYRRVNTRVAASQWIFSHIPAHSRIGFEHWDDPAPLHVPGPLTPEKYEYNELPLYNDDTREKWKMVTQKLEETDYIIMTSNRLWRSLPAIPGRYPYTANYYRLLASGKLGFEPIATFTSYPCLLPNQRPEKPSDLTLNIFPPPVSVTSTPYCLLALNDDGAEESFTVYDHPRVIIYKNTSHEPSLKLYGLITGI